VNLVTLFGPQRFSTFHAPELQPGVTNHSITVCFCLLLAFYPHQTVFTWASWNDPCSGNICTEHHCVPHYGDLCTQKS